MDQMVHDLLNKLGQQMLDIDTRQKEIIEMYADMRGNIQKLWNREGEIIKELKG